MVSASHDALRAQEEGGELGMEQQEGTDRVELDGEEKGVAMMRRRVVRGMWMLLVMLWSFWTLDSGTPKDTKATHESQDFAWNMMTIIAMMMCTVFLQYFKQHGQTEDRSARQPH